MSAHLDTNGIGHTLQELDMCLVELSGALSAPDEVRRAVVEEARCGVETGQCLLVVQQQALVRCVELSLTHCCRFVIESTSLQYLINGSLDSAIVSSLLEGRAMDSMKC